MTEQEPKGRLRWESHLSSSPRVEVQAAAHQRWKSCRHRLSAGYEPPWFLSTPPRRLSTPSHPTGEARTENAQKQLPLHLIYLPTFAGRRPISTHHHLSPFIHTGYTQEGPGAATAGGRPTRSHDDKAAT